MLVLPVAKAQAFGLIGHRVVGAIAEQHIKPKTLKKIHAITDGDSLAEIANWSDFVRSDPAWSHADTWHYMSIGDTQTFDSYKHPESGDILTALAKFEAVLRDPKANKVAKREALAFYVHLLGDLHQPLHVGRKDDRGGNDIKVYWFYELSNLHRVWDTQIIEYQMLSYTEYVAFISNPKSKQQQAWGTGDYISWAKESQALRAQVYDFGKQSEPEMPTLGYQYIFNNKALVEQRLVQAGVRLGYMLEQIFGKWNAEAVWGFSPYRQCAIYWVFI